MPTFTLAFTTVHIILAIISATAWLMFYWGMPIAAFKWYRAERSRGTRLLFCGLLLFLTGRCLGRFLHFLSVFFQFEIPFTSPLFWLLGEAGMYIALAGFAMIVLNEAKVARRELPTNDIP